MSLRQRRGGLDRRDFLAFGSLGAAQVAAPFFASASLGEIAAPPGVNAGILMFLRGGPSHIDTFDLKPEAPAEYRGEFKPIATRVPGMQVCEHLPRLARCADKFAVVRGVSHTFAAHSLGSEYLYTGTRPLASLEYPTYGAVVTKERPPQAPVPGHVLIPSGRSSPGFLGSRYGGYATGGLPAKGRPMPVRGLTLPVTLPLSEFDRRHELLKQLDRRFASLESADESLSALDEFNAQAHAMIRSPKMQEAFNMSKESPKFVERFGDGDWGAACLLTIRLIEAGVRFVTLSFGTWDTHANNFGALKGSLLPKFDQALSGLISGLDERGLLASTAILATGEFGRTPKINDSEVPGRDHYPKCMTVLMAGGRTKTGQVVGASDRTGSAPLNEPYSPDDVAATFYANLGIDPKKVYHTPGGRPITLIRDGSVIEELLS